MIEHLYIHVPFCSSKCHYCGFYSESSLSSRQRMAGYPELVANELALRAEGSAELRHWQPQTIYTGGGTPSLLGGEGFTALARVLKESVDLSRLTEWSVEINPASATPELFAAMRAAGVSRVTFGMQSFQAEVLRLVNRTHTPPQAVAAVQCARAAGFQNIGVDLIAGLPGVTAELWRSDLQQSLALAPSHISIYNLTVEPGTRLAEMAAGGLRTADEDQQMELLALAEEDLAAQGFSRYEISNYALTEYECRHNLGIWRGNDYLGLGPSAASRIGLRRIENLPDLSAYTECLQRDCLPTGTSETLSRADDDVERSLFALRLREGFSPAECRERFAVSAEVVQEWERTLEKFALAGAVERGGKGWRLTGRGREICDYVIRELI